MGEVHIKDEHAYNIGREVISQFSLRGVETPIPSNIYSTLAMIPVSYSIDFIFKIFSLIQDLPYGSTITACLEPVDGETLVNVFPWQVEVSDKVNVLLEAGGSDLLAVVSLYIWQAMHWNVLVWPVLKITGYNNRPVNWVSAYLAVQFARFFYGDLDDVSPYLFTPLYWLIPHRNQLMVDNIIKTLGVRNTSDEMLVITGDAHAEGMARLLIEKHGLSDITQQVIPDNELKEDTNR